MAGQPWHGPTPGSLLIDRPPMVGRRWPDPTSDSFLTDRLPTLRAIDSGPAAGCVLTTTCLGGELRVAIQHFPRTEPDGRDAGMSRAGCLPTKTPREGTGAF